MNQSISLFTMQSESIKFPFCMVHPLENSNNNFKVKLIRESLSSRICRWLCCTDEKLYLHTVSYFRFATNDATNDRQRNQLADSCRLQICSLRRRMLTDETLTVTKVNQIFLSSWIDHTRSPTRTIRRLMRTGTGSQLIYLSTFLVPALC
jgi:hypothetical protein